MALTAGFAKRELTPPIGVELCGYGFYLNRRSTGVLDPLYARALVLADGNTQVALVTCDLIGLMGRTVAEARGRIEADAGIPASHVMFACSHTHAGPATIDIRGCGEMDADYVASLPGRLANAVIQAARAPEVCEVGIGRGEVAGLAFNRVEGDDGPVDPEVLVMQVRSCDKAIATVYNLTAHGVTLRHTNTLISADWPGIAAAEVAAAGAGEALFLQGSCGDVNPIVVHTGRHEEAGKLAGAAVLAAAGGTVFSRDMTLAAASRTEALPLQVTPLQELEARAADAEARVAELPDGPERKAAQLDLESARHAIEVHGSGPSAVLETEIQAIRVGDALILGHGGELFCEFGLALRSNLAPRPTFVVGYANDFVGYIPDPEDFERGGYAAATVPKMCGNFPFTTDVGARMVDAFARLAPEVLD